MRIPTTYKKIGPGLYFSEKDRKVKLLVKRPKRFGGAGGHRPWSATLVVENRNDALQKGYEFRNICHRLGHKPGEDIVPGAFDSMPTFREYLDRYWPDREHPIGNLCLKVRNDQWCIVRKSLIPDFGHLPLDRVLRPDLAAFQSQRSAAGASPYTVNAHMRVMKKIIRDAHDRKVMPELPKFPPKVRERKYQLQVTDDDVLAVLAVFDNPERGGVCPEWANECTRELKPFFTVAACTGLTLGDLETLRWSEVDLQKGAIRRVRNKTGVESVIGMAPEVREALQEQAKTRNYRSIDHSVDLVFLSRSNQRLSRTTIVRTWNWVKKKAGITARFRFHDLRHLYVTRLANAGIGGFGIMKAAGHSNPTMSAQYTHGPSPEAIAAVAAAGSLRRQPS
jgi:integrase